MRGRKGYNRTRPGVSACTFSTASITAPSKGCPSSDPEASWRSRGRAGFAIEGALVDVDEVPKGEPAKIRFPSSTVVGSHGSI